MMRLGVIDRLAIVWAGVLLLLLFLLSNANHEEKFDLISWVMAIFQVLGAFCIAPWAILRGIAWAISAKR